MSIKAIFIYLSRILLLTIVLTIGNIISGMVSGLAKSGATQTPEEASNAFSILLIINLINAILLSFVLVRSRWCGWKLIASVSIIYFGIITFMSQLETFFFGKAMGIPNTLLSQIIVSGAITTFVFAPLAVLAFGKMKGKSEQISFSLARRKALRWKLPVLAILYVILYLVFGYYIAWQSPEVRQYYTHSTDLLPFGQHIANLIRTDAGLLLFQLFRGFLWTGLVLLILQSCKGKKWELVLVSGLLLGLFFTLQLFLPNPFMPENVRIAHFVETSTSTFLFGIIAALLLYPSN